ncbi:pilus assembly protein PilX [Caldimonas sp. KR1-144]|uniref:pilus assembly protein PilX n=1 Tax=Caldimonas sp. KR1-144 TaxID=3400911 RepID=UPI003C0F932A
MKPSLLRSRCRDGERGASLMFALVALVALAFAAVALVRSVDTGALVMGNLGFKQDATATADQVAERAINWLETNAGGNTLYSNITTSGYYASSVDTLDPTGNGTAATRAMVDWDGDGTCASSGACLSTSADVTVGSNTGRYVITRLCRTTGDPNASGNSCSSPAASTVAQGPNRGEIKYGTARLAPGPGGPYYRVIVRVVGGRGTVSYTETIVTF